MTIAGIAAAEMVDRAEIPFFDVMRELPSNSPNDRVSDWRRLTCGSRIGSTGYVAVR
jgi:hypothetical protein